MTDTYGHKPSADELLHDLGRLADANNGALIVVTPLTPTGPVERIVTAVGEYMSSTDWDASQPVTPDHVDYAMEIEHGLWVEVCNLLRARGVEINDDDKLARTIELWGERLVELRTNQDSTTRQKALDEKQSMFDALREDVSDEG